MPATVTQLLRYPVKGLTGETLESVALVPGRGIPHDRRFALAHGAAPRELDGTAWAPKGQFYTLAQEERLAQLGLAFDEASEILTITRAGKPVARGKASEPLGQTLLNQFFAAFLSGSPRGQPRLVAGRDVSYSDSDEPYLSLLNLASVADMARVARQTVDPRRFRANFWVEGLEPWVERNWTGRRLTIGEAELEVIEPIERCAATTVNPDTATRDLNVPRLLQAGYGHLCQGVYARVLQGGRVAVGDRLTLS